MNNHEQAVDRAVRAWRSATEVYSNLFQSLADAAAGEPHIFQSGRLGRAELAEMARTATEAKTAAYSFPLYYDLKKQQAAAAREAKRVWEGGGGEERSAEPVGTEHSTNGDAAGFRAAKRARPGKVPGENTQKGQKVLWNRGDKQPMVPFGTLGASEKAWRAELMRQRREKKRAKRAAKLAQNVRDRENAKAPVEDTSKPVFERDYIGFDGIAGAEPISGSIFPNVEYEDVSAEVDARLRTKAEKKLSAKKEKKRKRTSGSSTGIPEGDGESEKPEGKKARGDQSFVVDDGAGAKKHELEELEGVEGEVRGRKKKKKRKS